MKKISNKRQRDDNRDIAEGGGGELQRWMLARERKNKQKGEKEQSVVGD